MQIRATTLNILSKNRLLNKTVNSFGHLARGIYSGYVIGRSRSLAKISQQLPTQGSLEIREDGIFINHSQKVSTNSFLIQAFLELQISSIDFEKTPSYKDLLAISHGKVPPSKGIKTKHNEQTNEASLKSVITKNDNRVLRLNALTALYAGVFYALYRMTTLIISYGIYDSAADVLCSTFLVGNSVIFAGINALKQKFVADSIKHRDPIVTPQEKEQAVGKQGPKVTVLIPAYNEPVDVLRKSLAAAANLNYTNYEVALLLDSKPDSQNFTDVMAMVESEFGENGRVKVFARKKYPHVANQVLNKADNINAFLNYAHGKASEAEGVSFLDSEIVLITDADYQLHSDFLEETVPVLIKDPNTAYVMTPQNFEFDQKNHIEESSALLLNSSWQQVNKGVANSARVLFGGCNSIIRVSTLKEVAKTRATGAIDYLPTNTITEDLALTLEFMGKGYNSEFISRPLAITDKPISSLGDHISTYWRYAEGSIENTLKYTIPALQTKKLSLFSLEGLDYLSKACNPIMGGLGIAFLGFFPILGLFDVHLPLGSPIIPLAYYIILGKAAKSVLKNQGSKDPLQAAKIAALMYIHFPIFVHATYSAIKNHLTGKQAQYVTTNKSGNRTRVPLNTLIPLLGNIGINSYAFIGHLNEASSSLEPWRLEAAFWAALPILTISYGLAYFNGARNTLSDLKTGLYLETKTISEKLKDQGFLYSTLITGQAILPQL